MGLKSIKDLTKEDAKAILAFVYADKDENDRYFIDISHEPHINEDGKQHITFGGRSIIGIQYHNGQDRCILHFDNTKAILWLYKNGYDILEQLEDNQEMSSEEIDFDNLAFVMYQFSLGDEAFKPEVKHNWTVEYVQRRAKEAYEKYYLKIK